MREKFALVASKCEMVQSLRVKSHMITCVITLRESNECHVKPRCLLPQMYKLSFPPLSFNTVTSPRCLVGASYMKRHSQFRPSAINAPSLIHNTSDRAKLPSEALCTPEAHHVCPADAPQ